MKKIKSLVFVSNYFNHHQRYLSDEFSKRLKDGYHFIATMPMEAERQALGWEKIDVNYVVYSYESQEEYQKSIDLINNADVVVFGSAPHYLIKERIESGKVVLRYSERPLKKGIEPLRYLPRLIKWRKQFPNNKQVYLLCASAYTYADYKKFGMFKNRAFKWAYFTEVKQYENVLEVINNKEINSLLWCGRFIDWKHTKDALITAKRLKQDNYNFRLNVIGTGALEEQLKQYVEQNDLMENVVFLGSMSPEQVRAMMEKSEIFLFTSDRQEGWGAVLNEAMNSACAVVSSHAIGATPYLVKDGKNGLTYKSGDLENLYKKVKFLLDNKGDRQQIGENAYYTMLNEWSPEIAATRVLELCENILNKQNTDLYQDGPCSRAGLVKNNWFSEKKNGAK